MVPSYTQWISKEALFPGDLHPFAVMAIAAARNEVGPKGAKLHTALLYRLRHHYCTAAGCGLQHRYCTA